MICIESYIYCYDESGTRLYVQVFLTFAPMMIWRMMFGEIISHVVNAPVIEHYNAFKQIFRHVKSTKDDGIYFWRK